MKNLAYGNPNPTCWVRHAYETVRQTLVDVDYSELERRVLQHARGTSNYVWVDEWSDYGYQFPLVGENEFCRKHPCSIPAVDAWHARMRTEPVARNWEPYPAPFAGWDSWTVFDEVHHKTAQDWADLYMCRPFVDAT